MKIEVQEDWERDLYMVSCWIQGYKAAKNIYKLPGEDSLENIIAHIQIAKHENKRMQAGGKAKKKP